VNNRLAQVRGINLSRENNMPFICKIRTDIPDGILQVLDLRPNTSQRSLIYEPPGQTKYINRVQNDTVATTTSGGDDVMASAASGVAAYLLDHVEAGGLGAGTSALLDADANTIAAAIIAAMDAGSDLDLTAVNALLSATVATTELTDAGGSASTGSLTDLLKILAGAEYTMPAGAVTESPTGTFDPTEAGAFAGDDYRHTYQTGSLEISLGVGELAGLTAATFEYDGTAGAAVVVLDDDGTVKTALS